MLSAVLTAEFKQNKKNLYFYELSYMLMCQSYSDYALYMKKLGEGLLAFY